MSEIDIILYETQPCFELNLLQPSTTNLWWCILITDIMKRNSYYRSKSVSPEQKLCDIPLENFQLRIPLENQTRVPKLKYSPTHVSWKSEKDYNFSLLHFYCSRGVYII